MRITFCIAHEYNKVAGGTLNSDPDCCEVDPVLEKTPG